LYQRQAKSTVVSKEGNISKKRNEKLHVETLTYRDQAKANAKV
jgi:hypothetical protein